MTCLLQNLSCLFFLRSQGVCDSRCAISLFSWTSFCFCLKILPKWWGFFEYFLPLVSFLKVLQWAKSGKAEGAGLAVYLGHNSQYQKHSVESVPLPDSSLYFGKNLQWFRATDSWLGEAGGSSNTLNKLCRHPQVFHLWHDCSWCTGVTQKACSNREANIQHAFRKHTANIK